MKFEVKGKCKACGSSIELYGEFETLKTVILRCADCGNRHVFLIGFSSNVKLEKTNEI